MNTYKSLLLLLTTAVLSFANATTDVQSKISGIPIGIPSMTGNSGKYLTNNATDPSWSSLLNLDLTTGVTGVLPIANGGTSQSTANGAFNALAPVQAGATGKFLTSNGTDTSWATISSTPALSAITAATGTNTIDNLNFAQTWNNSTIASETGYKFAATAGSLLTGNLVQITQTVGNAGVTGNLLSLLNSGNTTNTINLNVQNSSGGLSTRGVLVNMSNSSGGHKAIEVTDASGGAGAQGLSVTMSSATSTTTTSAIFATTAGTSGPTVATLTSTGATGNNLGLSIDLATTGSGALGERLTMSSTSATGTALSVVHAGTSGYAGNFNSTGTGIRDVLRVQNDVTAATGSEPRITFGAKRTTGGQTDFAGISGVIQNIGNAAYAGDLVFYTSTGGAAMTEVARLNNAAANFSAPITMSAANANTSKVNLLIDQHTTFSNAAVVIDPKATVVAQIGSMSASRIATLPAANAVNAGHEILVIDESGTVTATNTVVVTAAGSDTIDGNTTTVLNVANDSKSVVSDGVSKWTTRVRTSLSNAANTIVKRDSLGAYGAESMPSGQIVSVNNAASPYTIPTGVKLIKVDASGGNVQLNLPNPTLGARTIKVVTTGVSFPSNLITFHRFASENIQYFAGDLTVYSPQGNYELQSDLVDWFKTSASTNSAVINFTSTTFVIPNGVNNMLCEGRSAWGGGGGGASGGGGSAATPGGGGGSGSASTLTLIVGKMITVTPGASVVVTIGAHGTGGLGGIHKAANAAGATETASATPATAGTSTTFGSILQYLGGNTGSPGGANATFSSGGAAGGTPTGFQYSNAAGAAGGNNAVAGTTGPNGASSIFALRGVGGVAGTSAALTGGGGGGGGGPGGGDANCAAGTADGGGGGAVNTNGSNGGNAPAQTSCPGGGGGGGGGGGTNAAGTTGGDGGNGADGVDGVLRCRFNE